MKAPKEFLKLVFQNSNVSDKVKNFVEYLINEVNTLQYAAKPDYLTIHSKINESLKSCGYANEENFCALFAITDQHSASPKTSLIKRNTTADEYDSLISSDNDDNDEKNIKWPKKATYNTFSSDDDDYMNQNLKSSNPFNRLVVASAKTFHRKTDTGDHFLNHDDSDDDDRIDKFKASKIVKSVAVSKRIPKPNHVKERLDGYLSKMAYLPPPLPSEENNKYFIKVKTSHAARSQPIQKVSQSTQTNISCVNEKFMLTAQKINP